ncbi:MAG: OmpA family protein [Bryobacteraceae bacterium]|nr:OmpA family protein [Bryobacteraceae bacterium]
MRKRKITAVVVLAFSLVMVSAGCRKKPPAPPPPPPPAEPKPAPPAKPSISTFVAEPSTIQRGQSSTLRWSVSNATEVSIEPGIGSVQPSGNRQVFPSSTTTYRLTAKGPGGADSASATVTVSQPPPPPPPAAPPPKKSLMQRLEEEVRDAYFDYDKYDIRDDQRSVLTNNASALRAILNDFSGAVITVEGHCDERGSAEYNLGLGDRRATAAKEFLVQLGVPESQLRTISYGKERPQCTESNESCWQRNRRAHFSAGQ